MATQLRLRSAKILLVSIGGLGTEIVKNLVLGGINSIEILDGSVVKEEDFGCQFFLPNDDSIIGKQKLPLIVDRIVELNNRVKITTNTNSLNSVITDEEYFKKFDLIIATELNKQEMLKLNKLTRSINVPVYISGLHGMFGYIITDLISHESATDLDAGNRSRDVGTKLNFGKEIIKLEPKGGDKETVTILDTFKPISEIFESNLLPLQLNKRQLKRLSGAFPLIFALFEFQKSTNPEDCVDEKLLKEAATRVAENFKVPSQIITDEYIDKFSKQAFTEFSPIAAILGGALAQDVIQFLSKKESPINNVLILDGTKPEMPIYTL